jgi:hypothetical protein
MTGEPAPAGVEGRPNHLEAFQLASNSYEAIKLILIDHRSHMCACFNASSTTSVFMRSVRAATKRSWMPRGRGAALPSREECTVGCALDRNLDLGVIEHHKRVLAAHFDMHTFLGIAAVAASAILRPVATNPVSETVATSRCRNRVSPISLPPPMTRLKTPAGSPDREMISKGRAEPRYRMQGPGAIVE